MQFTVTFDVHHEELVEMLTSCLNYDAKETMEGIISYYKTDGYNEIAFRKALAVALYESRYDVDLTLFSRKDGFPYSLDFSILNREQIQDIVDEVASQLDLEKRYYKYMKSLKKQSARRKSCFTTLHLINKVV